MKIKSFVNCYKYYYLCGCPRKYSLVLSLWCKHFLYIKRLMRMNKTLLFPSYILSLYSLSQFSLVYNTLSARFAQIFSFSFSLNSIMIYESYGATSLLFTILMIYEFHISFNKCNLYHCLYSCNCYIYLL